MGKKSPPHFPYGGGHRRYFLFTGTSSRKLCPARGVRASSELEKNLFVHKSLNCFEGEIPRAAAISCIFQMFFTNILIVLSEDTAKNVRLSRCLYQHRLKIFCKNFSDTGFS